jgi:hypothetical protein
MERWLPVCGFFLPLDIYFFLLYVASSQWVDGSSYVASCHWVDGWPYAASCHWVDSWPYAASCHWENDIILAARLMVVQMKLLENGQMVPHLSLLLKDGQHDWLKSKEQLNIF